MGRSRSSADGGESPELTPSVSIEVDHESHRTSTNPSASGQGHQGVLGKARRRRVRIGAVAGLSLISALLLSLLLSGITRADPVLDEVDETPTEAGTETPQQSAQPEVAPEQLAAQLLDQLPTTPDVLISNLLVAWIGDDDRLNVRQLGDGSDLETGVLAQRNLPPLPAHIKLLGAPNSTWLLDLVEPAQSGKLSNTVRMVRLGNDLDSYGFISTTADETLFFVGSLWGPSMSGTARVPSSTNIFPVPQTGIVVAGQDAISGVIEGNGIRALPTRLGRVVAAGDTKVAGIHCDDLGRCVGRVTDWDGDGEVQIDAAGLAAPVVRISPDGRYIVAAGNSEWRLYDLSAGTSRSVARRIGVNDSLMWSPDSSVLLWVANGVLLAIDVNDELFSPTRVRQAGNIGERLDGSDLALFMRN